MVQAMEIEMDNAEQLHEYYKNMIGECEVHIDANGNMTPAYMDDVMVFEILEDGILRVTYDLMELSVATVNIRQYAYDNPAYYWMDGAYLVCAMRECGWKMVPYTEYDGEGTHHHLHNGSGVQLFFKKVVG